VTPNTLRAQYLGNSCRCYLATVANYCLVCFEAVRSAIHSDRLASCLLFTEDSKEAFSLYVVGIECRLVPVPLCSVYMLLLIQDRITTRCRRCWAARLTATRSNLPVTRLPAVARLAASMRTSARCVSILLLLRMLLVHSHTHRPINIVDGSVG